MSKFIVTVFDDEERDFLFGQLGRDWYFADIDEVRAFKKAREVIDRVG